VLYFVGMNKTWLQRTKAQLKVLSAAIRALDSGDIQAAMCALQMSGLTAEQGMAGCVARLTTAYKDVNGYGPRRKVGRNLLQEAFTVLKDHGVRDILTPS
jgi:hypothetical protein